MLQASAARSVCILRASPRQLTPAPVSLLRRRLHSCRASSLGRMLHVVAGASASDGAGKSPTSNVNFTDKMDIKNFERLTTLDNQALSSSIKRMKSEDNLLSFIKVAESCGKPQLAEQARQRRQVLAASKYETQLAQWQQKVQSNPESDEAFTAVNQIMGMSLPQFLAILKGRSYLLSKPVMAVLRPNTEALVQRLGSREAALQVVLEVPDVLALGASVNDVAYLKTEFGWDVEDFSLRSTLSSGGGPQNHWLYINREKPMLYSHCLAGPLVQQLLHLCQQELGLSPEVMLRRHLDVLRSPVEPIVRLLYIKQHHLQSKIPNILHPGGDLDKDTSFLTMLLLSRDEQLISIMGVSMLEWRSFYFAWIHSEEGATLKQEDAEYTRMARRVQGIVGNLQERVERAVERASKSGGQKVSK